MLDNAVKDVSHRLLQRGHSPATAAQIYQERVVERPLSLRPAEGDKSDARAVRQKKRALKIAQARRSKKPRPLSAKRKRSLQVFEVPLEQRKYVIYEPMYQMWCQYIQEVLGLKSGDSDGSGCARLTAQMAGPKIWTADLHGALIEVVRCRCPSRVGVKGIVIKDTKFTFEIITTTNRLKSKSLYSLKLCGNFLGCYLFSIALPKEYSVFRFTVASPNTDDQKPGVDQDPNAFKFEIMGSQFANRAPERATKKLKMHLSQDL